MFELFRSASDDQVALLGCAGALLGSGLLMYLSYFVGPMSRREPSRKLEALIQHREGAFGHAVDSARDKAA
jgi:hypothetical protein